MIELQTERLSLRTCVLEDFERLHRPCRTLAPGGWPDFEIGWTLHPKYWGCRYATEAAVACIQYACDQLHRTHVISLITPENAVDSRVAERIGEHFQGEVSLPHLPDRSVLQYGLEGRLAAAEIRFTPSPAQP